MTDEPWMRLAGAVRQRRDELGMTQAELAAASGVSEPTIRVIETARRSSYQRATLRAVAQALRWTPDSVDRILRGEQPAVESPAAPPGDFDMVAAIQERQRRMDEAEAEIRNLKAKRSERA